MCIFIWSAWTELYYIQGSGTSTRILARYASFHMVQVASVSMDPYTQHSTTINQTLSNVQSIILNAHSWLNTLNTLPCMLLSMVHHMCYIEFPFQCMYIYNLAAFFNIHSGGANAPPALRFAPPVRLFLPPEKVPFYKKYTLLFIGRNKTQRFLMWHNANLALFTRFAPPVKFP